MNWYVAESDNRPELVDETSSAVSVYIRRNITIETKEAKGDDKHTFYRYEECKLTKEGYALFKEQEQNRADIDYLAIMTEVDI